MMPIVHKSPSKPAIIWGMSVQHDTGGEQYNEQRAPPCRSRRCVRMRAHLLRRFQCDQRRSQFSARLPLPRGRCRLVAHDDRTSRVLRRGCRERRRDHRQQFHGRAFADPGHRPHFGRSGSAESRRRPQPDAGRDRSRGSQTGARRSPGSGGLSQPLAVPLHDPRFRHPRAAVAHAGAAAQAAHSWIRCPPGAARRRRGVQRSVQ